MPVVPRRGVHQNLREQRLHVRIPRILLRPRPHRVCIGPVKGASLLRGGLRIPGREGTDEGPLLRAHVGCRGESAGRLQSGPRRIVARRVHRGVDVWAQNEGLPPVADRTCGVETRRFPNSAVSLGMMEPVGENESLMEEALSARDLRRNGHHVLARSTQDRGERLVGLGTSLGRPGNEQQASSDSRCDFGCRAEDRMSRPGEPQERKSTEQKACGDRGRSAVETAPRLEKRPERDRDEPCSKNNVSHLVGGEEACPECHGAGYGDESGRQKQTMHQADSGEQRPDPIAGRPLRNGRQGSPALRMHGGCGVKHGPRE